MENWMISMGIALVGVISTFAVLRANVQRLNEVNKDQAKKLEDAEKFINEKRPMLEHLSKSEEQFFKRMNAQGDDLTSLKEKISQAPTMKEVRAEFVSKELFLQMQKHIDEKFDRLENGIQKILTKLES